MAEVLDDELRVLEGAVAVVQRGPDARVSEADDVGAAVAGEVGEEARVFLGPPAARVVAEVLDDEPRALERAVAVVEGHPHPGVSEPDDVRTAVAGEVGEKARMLLHPPTARHVAEVLHDELGTLEGAVAVAQRHPDALVAEADDVRAAVAGEVGQEARVLLHPPTARAVAEVRHHELWGGEGGVAPVQGDPGARLAEADDVGAAVAREVGEEAWVFLHPPSARVVAEVLHDEPRSLEGAAAVVQGDPGARVAEADDLSLIHIPAASRRGCFCVRQPPAE